MNRSSEARAGRLAQYPYAAVIGLVMTRRSPEIVHRIDCHARLPADVRSAAMPAPIALHNCEKNRIDVRIDRIHPGGTNILEA